MVWRCSTATRMYVKFLKSQVITKFIGENDCRADLAEISALKMNYGKRFRAVRREFLKSQLNTKLTLEFDCRADF